MKQLVQDLVAQVHSKVIKTAGIGRSEIALGVPQAKCGTVIAVEGSVVRIRTQYDGISTISTIGERSQITTAGRTRTSDTHLRIAIVWITEFAWCEVVEMGV